MSKWLSWLVCRHLGAFPWKPFVWCHGDLLRQQPGWDPAEPNKWCPPHAGAAMKIAGSRSIGKEHSKELLLSTLEHRWILGWAWSWKGVGSGRPTKTAVACCLEGRLCWVVRPSCKNHVMSCGKAPARTPFPAEKLQIMAKTGAFLGRGPSSCMMSEHQHFWFDSESCLHYSLCVLPVQFFLRSRMRLKNEERRQIYCWVKVTPDIVPWGGAYTVAVVAFGQEKGLKVATGFPMHFEIWFEVGIISSSVRNSQALVPPCEPEPSSAATSSLCKYRGIAGNWSNNQMSKTLLPLRGHVLRKGATLRSFWSRRSSSAPCQEAAVLLALWQSPRLPRNQMENPFCYPGSREEYEEKHIKNAPSEVTDQNWAVV